MTVYKTLRILFPGALMMLQVEMRMGIERQELMVNQVLPRRDLAVIIQQKENIM